jgi:hypothetical protein
MTNAKTTPPTKQPSPIRSVLDAISLRSVFSLDLAARMDRMRLIEAVRAGIDPETDPALIRDLLARRTETILALATHPSTDIDVYTAKAEVLGKELIFPEVSRGEYLLLSIAAWSALIMDGKDVGAVVQVSPTTPGSSKPAKH